MPGLAGKDFVGFAQRSGKMWRCGRDESVTLSLGEGDWEIVSYAPVERGVAILGLADKFNSTAAVSEKKWRRDGSLTVRLRDGGNFLAWSERTPRRVIAGGRNVPFFYDAVTGRLSAKTPSTGRQEVILDW